MRHFGRAWLERGAGACRFTKPVYDGRNTRCLGQVNDEGNLSLTAQVEGITCATGVASLPDAPPPHTLAIAAKSRPPESERPRGSPTTLAAGTVLGVFEKTVTADELAEYCDGVSEDLSLYLDEGLVHPAQLLQMGNRSLTSNVQISPWMHVGSTCQHYGVAHVDEPLEARGRVRQEYEHKGHKFVELEVEIVGEGERLVATIDHKAIYQPRGSSD